jgi:hypothetical protein
MPLLTEERLVDRAIERSRFRLKTAGTKLNAEELAALEKHCRDRNMTPGEFIRELILTAIVKGGDEISSNDPALTEILGVRLLLVNVLRPLAAGQKLTPEAFDKLLDEISTAKHELAGKLASETGR